VSLVCPAIVVAVAGASFLLNLLLFLYPGSYYVSGGFS